MMHFISFLTFIKRKQFAVFCFLLPYLVSCEQEITVNLPKPTEKIVVEGRIEQGENPFVILSKNSPFFAKTDSNTLKNIFIRNAVVTVHDGSKTDTLKELYFPGMYFTFNMKGETGKTYTLKIVAEGKSYTASTTIIPPVALDSLWFKAQKEDSLGFIWAHLTDPAGLGNAYRWYAKRIGKDNDFIAPMGSVFDDKFIDGKSFDFAYNRGTASYSKAPDDDEKSNERGYFKRGDKVIIKFCTIDNASFNFFRRFEIESSNNGNPFSAPASLQSNVSGDALGLWCGYGVSLDTVELK